MWWGNIVPGAAMRGTTMPARGAAAERSTGGQSREGSGRGGDRAALPGADDAEALAPDYRRIVELLRKQAKRFLEMRCVRADPEKNIRNAVSEKMD